VGGRASLVESRVRAVTRAEWAMSTSSGATVKATGSANLGNPG
jgi:hypothetical protein